MPFHQYLIYLVLRVFFGTSRVFHEWDMLRLVNKERRQHRLHPLRMEYDLRTVARMHSADMAKQGYFSHTSPTQTSPADRISLQGITDSTTGENLAFVQGYKQPTKIAMDGLMRSPGHRENILRPQYTGVGIGLYISKHNAWYYTQNFVRRLVDHFTAPKKQILGKQIFIKFRFRTTPPAHIVLRVLRYEQEVESTVLRSSNRSGQYIYQPQQSGTYHFQLFHLEGSKGTLLNQTTCRVYRSWLERIFG